MSLINFIQKIQKKPRYIRLQILWLAVFVSMVFIVSLWVVSLKSSLPETAEEIKEPLEKLGKEVPSLKEAFKASIGAFFEKATCPICDPSFYLSAYISGFAFGASSYNLIRKYFPIAK